jgi:RimJ/RimL family protein N-acetyltransferase
MFEILKDPLLYEFTGDTPPADVETLTRQYEFWEKHQSPDGSQLWLNWALRERQGGTLIGHAQATVAAGNTEVAWVIGASRLNRGYASEAATGLVKWLLGFGVREIRASIHPEHEASIKVAERAGLLRTDVVSGGEVVWKLSVC